MTRNKRYLFGLCVCVLGLLTGCGNNISSNQSADFKDLSPSAVRKTNVKSALSSSVVQGGNRLMSDDYFNVDYRLDAINSSNKLDAFLHHSYRIQNDISDMKSQYESPSDFRKHDGVGAAVPKGEVHTKMTHHTLIFWHKLDRHSDNMPLNYVKYKLVNVKINKYNHDKRFIFQPVAIKWSYDTFAHKLSKRKSANYCLVLTRIYRFSKGSKVSNNNEHGHYYYNYKHKSGILPR